ncbi:hypothetical protein GQ54DRAFT_300171 [Martensiomyces pterosporus]|nr:hypothetical protein GQ54DRAFT_300171 [Martensiomyces pterosporus]
MPKYDSSGDEQALELSTVHQTPEDSPSQSTQQGFKYAHSNMSSLSDGVSTSLDVGVWAMHRRSRSFEDDTLKAGEAHRNSSEDISLAQTRSQASRRGSFSSISSSSLSIMSGHSFADEPSDYDRPIGISTDTLQVHEPRHKSSGRVIREMIIEVLPALLISVAGSIFAGYTLGHIQDTPAFDKIPALFIMVPVLLNLKSNIELNMSTRLSTQANMGVFDSKAERFESMRSNMDLILLQSTIVGACVGLISALLSLIPGGSSNSSSDSIFTWLSESSILLASGVGCAVIGSGVIGLLTCFTVAVSHLFGVDPDNIGTPITSSFGDMSTLLILGGFTAVLIKTLGTLWPWVVVALFAGFGVYLFRVVRRNEQIAHHIKEGWLPLVYAAITSSVAGIIVEKCADRYPGMPALVPVLNGIGGNIGTVFSSRLSTSLHRRQSNSAEHNLVMLILLIINIPVQVGFLATHKALDPTSVTITVGFFVVYTSATVIHALAILFLGRAACSFLWSRGYDPDDYVNPFITGTGDMLGTSLLALVFLIEG